MSLTHQTFSCFLSNFKDFTFGEILNLFRIMITAFFLFNGAYFMRR
jgi:hypothetical protein